MSEGKPIGRSFYGSGFVGPLRAEQLRAYRAITKEQAGEMVEQFKAAFPELSAWKKEQLGTMRHDTLNQPTVATDEGKESLIERMTEWLLQEKQARWDGDEDRYERLKGGIIDYVFEALGVLHGYEFARAVKDEAIERVQAARRG